MFPLEVTAARRHDWFRVTGRDGRWVIPDWERVAQEWDATQPTVLGHLNAAGPPWRSTETTTVNADSGIWLTYVARDRRGRATRIEGNGFPRAGPAVEFH